MPAPFSYFVILAEMRTGSNALEERINDFTALTSFGEVFNPHFIGKPETRELFGVDTEVRNADPLRLIDRLRENTKGLPGFRLFGGHDARVIDHVLADRDCGKIVLTRNPLESYVSLKIARKTGQWWLGDMKSARQGQARFDAGEFERYLAEQREFHGRIRHRLQSSGQSAFPVRYEDLDDPSVIRGIPAFLGVSDETATTTRKGKVQNPAPLSEKVSNYQEMVTALAARDPFETEAIPGFEPRRGANVPAYVAAATSPLLFVPLKGVDMNRVERWMAVLDGVSPDDLQRGFTQKTLRQWKRRHIPHRTFVVVSHPLERAHRSFVTHILTDGPDAYPAIRQVLRTSYRLPLPETTDGPDYDKEAHRDAFLAFLRFLKGNLGGQTSVRVDGSWASQSVLLQGVSEVLFPDRIIHENELAAGLCNLSEELLGRSVPVPEAEPLSQSLEGIYDTNLEAAARAAYQKDYMMFGFGNWA